MNAAQAFIAFLRVEATNADDRARNLRATAAIIEANQVTRGRKKRKREPKAAKKAHTAYTLYVQENYESAKKAHGDGDMPSKDVISIIARQWSEVGEQEKQAWQYRADQLKQAQESNGIPGEAIAETGLPELPSNEDWDRKRPARKSPPKQGGLEAV